MAMGKRKQEQQGSLWIKTADLPRSASHPFYQKLNQVLSANGFDGFVEELCRKFYAQTLGRPGLAPGVYFRCMLIGYFEGLDSERGIAWRCADSLSLREFLGMGLDEQTPDHSTLSRTRRLMDLETHQAVFAWVLKLLAGQGLARGKTVGIDATTLEANAAMRSIVRNDTGQKYDEFLKDLAKASGIDTPTREDLIKVDKSRKNKASNEDWHNPFEPDAKIAKMKDGRTHLAHKQEHAVDMESGAVLAVTIQEADEGDTITWRETVEETWQNLNTVRKDARVAEFVHENPVEELVQDKGYHSNRTMADYAELGIRSYVSEPGRGRRRWKGRSRRRIKGGEQLRTNGSEKESLKTRKAVYANRRRIRGNRGKRLLRKRGELIERSFAHVLETGGMRRTHLRGHINILKRMLVHAGGFNLGLLMRKLIGIGKPRRLQGLFSLIFGPILLLGWVLGAIFRPEERRERREERCAFVRRGAGSSAQTRGKQVFTTGC